MTIRIIDNKKIDLTNDEHKVYKEICKAYTTETGDGSYLFKDLFETDDLGRITFLRPPQTYTSMEVFMFLISIMVHQHLGQACNETYNVLKEARSVIDEGKLLIKELKEMK